MSSNSLYVVEVTIAIEKDHVVRWKQKVVNKILTINQIISFYLV